MAEGADGAQLRPDLRAQLETIAEQLGLGVGRARLTLEFQNGRLAWWEPTMVRRPASELGQLGGGRASTDSPE